jgi:hypothetical protein
VLLASLLMLVLLLISLHYCISGIYRTKSWEFLIFSTHFFMNFPPFWRPFGKFREHSGDVGVHIVLMLSTLCCWQPCWCLYCCWLYDFLHPCCCRSPFCSWHCDIPIVSAAVGLPSCCCFIVFASIPAFDGVHSVLAGLLLLSFLLLLAFLLLWAVMV